MHAAKSLLDAREVEGQLVEGFHALAQDSHDQAESIFAAVLARDPVNTEAIAGRVLVTSGTAGVVSFIDPVGSGTGTLVVGNLPVAFGNFVATVGTHCPDAPPCDARASIDAGAGPLVALLDALADTIRHAVIPDAALGQALTDAVARCRDRAVQGDDTGLGSELDGVVRTLRRGTRRHGIDRSTG